MNVNPELVAVAIGANILTERRKPISDTIVDLTGKENPVILGIPSACRTIESFEYFRHGFDGHFSELIGIRTDFLHDFKTPPTPLELEHKLGEADAVYVSGGHTGEMMSFWAHTGIDTALRQAINEGKVMAGGSAGGIAWFESGQSDPLPEEVMPTEEDLVFTDGLGEICAGVAPHYDALVGGVELRRKSLPKMLVENSNVPEKFIGINNDAGLVVVRGLVSITRCSDKGRIYLVSKENDTVSEAELNISEPVLAAVI